MDYITTTNLRTQSSKLIETLKKGNPVSLVHRSKVIGVINPSKNEQVKTFDAKKVKKIIEAMNLPKLSSAEREKRYREHMMNKYGKGISRR